MHWLLNQQNAESICSQCLYLMHKFDSARYGIKAMKSYAELLLVAVDQDIALQHNKAMTSFAVQDSTRVVVVTGAGCSTESNIPDYRGPNGAYNTGFKPMTHQQVSHADLWLIRIPCLQTRIHQSVFQPYVSLPDHLMGLNCLSIPEF